MSRPLVAVAVSACFEAVQLLFGRSFDTDDLICNSIGMAIGGMMACIILERKPRPGQ